MSTVLSCYSGCTYCLVNVPVTLRCELDLTSMFQNCLCNFMYFRCLSYIETRLTLFTCDRIYSEADLFSYLLFIFDCSHLGGDHSALWNIWFSWIIHVKILGKGDIQICFHVYFFMIFLDRNVFLYYFYPRVIQAVTVHCLGQSWALAPVALETAC